jgi:predicted nuclease of predicted toxin-antitoxin system
VSDRIRLHLDEHIHSAIATGLRQRGIDATTPADVGLRGASDEQHLEFARQSGRVLVTQDKDFLQLHALGLPHAGIAYCKQGSRSIGHMLRALIVIYDSMSPDDVRGQLLYL